MAGIGPFESRPLLPEPLPADPMAMLAEWLAHAVRGRVAPNPDAMALATADADGTPTVRMVLAKKVDAAAGFIEFFTNYESRKSRALAARPVAAAVFHWDALERQARIEGPVTRSPAAESDRYFATRPWPKQVGGWASEQSRPVASRAAMLERVEAAMARLGVDPLTAPPITQPMDIPRPPHWGGWRVWARRVELWQGAPGRVHDRAEWTRTLSANGAAYAGGAWTATRLQP